MSHDAPDPLASRRRALNLIGAGLVAGPAAFAAGGAAAQSTPAAAGADAARPRMQDPRQQYPRPPFAAQTQAWPGLASKMQPPPDHGERSYVGSGRLAGRRALITGGDSGIGRAAAIAYAREGADVAINYLPAEESDAREVVALIEEAGRKAVAIPGDLRDERFCTQLVERAAAELGGLDILVNNAAMQRAQASILDITTEQFDATMKTNLYATFWLSKAAIPRMPAGAAIINTASIVASDPPAALLDYAATKGALVTFTKGLAKQLAERGIRVNAVAPGPYWTPLQPSGGQMPDQLPQFGSDSPLGRPGQPAEIASLFVLLASQEASYTSGNVFSSTGVGGDA
ncbi:NAD(P)-dependent oxidoreductase [Lysobacteraceae bacterium NML93-0399]|nr:NAD(P)-dependent oxidoreductase [Xanthomonadaceae bacterium NML93-0399]